MKLVVFADHEIGAALLSQLAARKDVEIVAAVTTQENAKSWWPAIAPVAAQHNVPLLHYPRDAATIQELKQADYFFLLSWKHVLPAAIFNAPRKGTINLHYSLLPKYRGVYPVNWVLMKGEKETGVTFHTVDGTVDGGDIVLQQKLAIVPQDTARSLQLRLDALAASMMQGVIEKLRRGDAPAPQGTNFSYYSKADFMTSNALDLNRSMTGREWLDLLRGKSFEPHGRNAYFVEDGKKYFVSLAITPEQDA